VFGCAVVEDQAGSLVELAGDAGEGSGAVDAQVGALGEVLPQQPVDVFVRASLPGCMRVGEEDLGSGGGGDLLVPEQLSSPVQVSVLRIGAGTARRAVIRASRTSGALWPCGRATRMTNRLVRSTSVAIADR
jgi:hypothetical protein